MNSHQAPGLKSHDLHLIGADDPAPVQLHNAEGRAPHLIVCDHASHAVPAKLGNLGLTDAELQQHIGWDPGALDIAKHLADALDAPLIYSSYSRLVCDLNRYESDPASMLATSDGIVVPGNAKLSPAARFRRIDEIFRPYHDAIRERLDAFERAGVVPTVLSIHTCTDTLNGAYRPWPISLSYAADTRISKTLVADLRARQVCEVGDNEPYSLDVGIDFTTCEHAMRRGLAHMQVEFRQDLVGSKPGAEDWTRRFLPSLQRALSDPDVHEARVHGFPSFTD